MIILYYIGSLSSGGKERRLIELLSYMKNIYGYKLFVIINRNIIEYKSFYSLNIEYKILDKKNNKMLIQKAVLFWKICKKIKPDLIHTWGRIPTFIALPSSLHLGIPIINSQITNAPSKINMFSLGNIIDRINFQFSQVIISNSKAGIQAYNPPENKSKVIYNGINNERFVNISNHSKIKSLYNIKTKYSVIMVASISRRKDHELFLELAEFVTSHRKDVSFIHAGKFDNNPRLHQRINNLCKKNKRILFLGLVQDIESLINACDIGVLFTNEKYHGEGVSNSILEYMALGKPVIANKTGGTNEILTNKMNGYIICTRNTNEIMNLISNILDDKDLRQKMSSESLKIINSRFQLDRMGNQYKEIYQHISK